MMFWRMLKVSGPNSKTSANAKQKTSKIRIIRIHRIHRVHMYPSKNLLGGLKHSILTFVPNPFSGMHPNDVLTYAESFRAKLENFCKCQTKNLKNSDTSDTSDTSIFAIFGVKNGDFQNLLKDSKTRANLLFDSGIICGMEPKPCKCQTKNLKTRSFSALRICALDFRFGDIFSEASRT